MIQTKNIETLEDFQLLKKGDLVAVEWKRDMYFGNKQKRFGTYEIVENKERTDEIILQVKNNVYFNYNMFLNPIIGVSNLKSIVLLRAIG
jgi:hypothetical protein